MWTMTLCQSTLKCRRWHLQSPTRSYLKQRRSWTSRSTPWISTRSLVPPSSSQPTTLFWKPASLSPLVLSWVEWYKKAREMQLLLPPLEHLLLLGGFIRLVNDYLPLLLASELLETRMAPRPASEYTYYTEYNLQLNDKSNSNAKHYDYPLWLLRFLQPLHFAFYGCCILSKSTSDWKDCPLLRMPFPSTWE